MNDARTLNGRYRLLEVLGTGGMGTVHRAVDLRLRREVAVKLLRTSVHDAADHRRRLEAEATILASLRHPSIAEVYDHDEDRDSPDRTPFVVMELIEGVTLAGLLRERGVLRWEEALAVVREIAVALAHLQTHGIVHRDLKPANIMLTEDSRVVLVDFGIARTATSTALTTTGALLGTVEYLSPEQIGGGSATPSTDLYALGLVAHCCLTGTSPFRRSSPIATAWAQVNDDLPALPSSVPPVVAGLVTALAAKASADRPADASAVVRTIDGLGLALALPEIGADDLAAEQRHHDDRAAVVVTTAALGRRRRSRWGTAGSAAAVALVAALLLAGERSPSVAESPETTVEAETPPPEDGAVAEVVSEPPVAPLPEPTPSGGTVGVAPAAPDAASTGSGNGNGNGNGNGRSNAGGNGKGNANGRAK